MKKEIALKTIKLGFENLAKMGEIEQTTVETYYSRIQNFINNHLAEKVKKTGNEKFYNPSFWKGKDVEEWIDKLIERYHNDEISATYVEGVVHAFGKLQEGVRDHKILGNKITKVRVGLKGSIKSGEGYLNKLHQEGVIDSKEYVTSIKPKGGELERILAAIPKTIENYESVVNLIKSQRMTGGRISAESKLKVGDLDLQSGIKTYNKDKNSFTRRTPIQQMDIDFYKKITDGKAPGAPLFEFKRDGKTMSVADSSKYVMEVLKAAAERSGVNQMGNIEKKDRNGNIKQVEMEMRYTSHSSRRGFAQPTYNATRYWNTKRIEREIGAYLNMQGSNKERIIERIQNEKKRINYHRIEAGKHMRDFTWEEKRRLYVSLLLGHSRIDVVSRYLDVDTSIAAMKKENGNQ